ncbi:MAG: hypothetical protein FWF80_00775, partial [Defluviitaleaceae bacterium]|nr:hypothetical protein [Defluviitaleaceae bacterium]
HEFTIPEDATFGVSAAYAFTVVNLSARGGGIQAANNYQWRYLIPQVRRFNSPYVVILMDTNSFNRRHERELFHLAMTQLADDGRLVFVVSPGDETTLAMRDRVRYITAANSRIRFWTEGDQVWWND